VSLLIGGIAYATSKHKVNEEARVKVEERLKEEKAAGDTSIPPEVDTLELQVGYGLVALVEGEGRGDLVDRIYSLRKEFAKDLGIIVPKVRIKDNLELQPAQYSILIKGVPVGGGELMSGYLLAMDPGGIDEEIAGIATKEPVFGLPALWIPEKLREKAQIAGYTVVDSATVIATHLSETIRKHAYELIGRQELQSLVENIQKTHPKVVEELPATVLPLGTILKVCQNLLREQVPVRDMLTILETLANHASTQKDPEALTEFARSALARTITQRLMNGGTELEVLTLDSRTEEMLMRAYAPGEGGGMLNLEPGYFERLVTSLQRLLEATVFNSGNPVLLCHPRIRAQVKKLVERFVPNLSVISIHEIASFARVKSLGSLEA
jgi:flagellar biosynthesis protein FlhA